MFRVTRAPLSLLGLLLLAAPLSAQQEDLALLLEADVDVEQHVHSLAFSPDGKIVAVGGRDIHLFDVFGEKPEKLATIKWDLFFGIPAVQFSPNGKFLAAAGTDKRVRVWSIENVEPKEVADETQHTEAVRCLAFSSNSKQLLSGGDDGSTILWDVADDGKLKKRFALKTEDVFLDVRAMAFNTRINRFITVKTNGDIHFLTGMPSKLTVATSLKIRLQGEPVIAVSPDGKSVAIGSGKEIHTYARQILKQHTDTVTGLAYSPSGKSLASCGRDGLVVVWNTQTTRVRFSTEPGDRFTCVAYPPPPTDGKPPSEALLVAADDKGKVRFMKLGPKDKK